MSRHMTVGGAICALALLLPTQAFSQFGNPCGTCAQPVVNPCAVPCYRTVPVTEYRQYQQTVQQPVCEVKYVDQKVTAYRPVTETRTVNVPTVSYQNVTECRTAYRNCGYWQTYRQCVHLPTPCEYDGRANIFGWLNRTAYSIRSTFTPRVITRRQYVPRTVAVQVPYTRTIAHHGTRQVSYKVTRMVAYTTTRKVAVNTVRYVTRKITRTQPVTVWRTVPIGSTIAYAPLSGTARTALAPTPDPVSAKKRTANANDSKFNDRTNDGAGQKFERDSKTGGADGKLDGLGIRRPAANSPISNGTSQVAGKFIRPNHVPTAVTAAHGWINRRHRLARETASNIGVATAAK